MRQNAKPALLALMLLVLPWLLAACGHTSPLLPSVPPPAIQPLPETARQTDSPTYSASASSDMERWQQRLTAPLSPASSASVPTTR